MKVIIAGPRDFHDWDKFQECVGQLSNFDVTEVVSGEANGVDAMGERWATASGIPVRLFPADWNANGRAAGPIRNREMAEYADMLLALTYRNKPSRGTSNMIKQAREMGLEVLVYEVDRQ